MSKTLHQNNTHKNLVLLVTCAKWKVGPISAQRNKLNQPFYGEIEPFKITHKPLLKWKSAWNKSCRSQKTEQKWYSKVFHLGPRRGKQTEFTDQTLKLSSNYSYAPISLSLSFHSLSLMAPYAAGGIQRPCGPGHPRFRLKPLLSGCSSECHAPQATWTGDTPPDVHRRALQGRHLTVAAIPTRPGQIDLPSSSLPSPPKLSTL